MNSFIFLNENLSKKGLQEALFWTSTTTIPETFMNFKYV